MPRIVKEPSTPPSLQATRPIDPQRPAQFNQFNPKRFLRNDEVVEQQPELLEKADAELRDPDGDLRKPMKASDWLTAIGGALVAILDSARLRTEFRPIVYGVGCLLTVSFLAVCGGAFLLIYLFKQ